MGVAGEFIAAGGFGVGRVVEVFAESHISSGIVFIISPTQYPDLGVIGKSCIVDNRFRQNDITSKAYNTSLTIGGFYNIAIIIATESRKEKNRE